MPEKVTTRTPPRTRGGVERFKSFASFDGTGSRAVEAWFLGPRGENAELLERLVVEAVRDQVYWRRNFHPEDPTHITEAIKRSPEYVEALGQLEKGYVGLLAFLKKSVPFFSMRYQGHMNWETTLPGILGYFAAMLYNPNNVAFEGSTATTILELLVGDDLCRMLGYRVPGLDADASPGAPRPWGHITCDGTVANIEAVWSARNLKFYPLALKRALESDARLAKARDEVTATPAGGVRTPLVQLDIWQALNLRGDEVLGLAAATAVALEIDQREAAKIVADAVGRYSLQTLGYQTFAADLLSAVKPAVVFVPGTKHYSFPKATALLGLGAANLIDVRVDKDARLDLGDLRQKLVACADEQRPVVAVVAVIGSTEESAVDPVEQILELREELRGSHGLDFVVHADAAWGGYHVSVVRKDFDMPSPVAGFADFAGGQHVTLSAYVRRQFAALGGADSITVDPHKSGYIPYPAGALCYRNSETRNLVTFAAPVVFHGDAEPTVGIYGIEGSKPGASVASVYLSHRVIRPSQSGYGQIIGRALYSCKRLYGRLLAIGIDEQRFYAVPLPRIPAGVPGDTDADKVAWLARHLGRPTPGSQPPIELDTLLPDLGPDQNILAYAFNFIAHTGRRNRSLALANEFNRIIYRELSLKPFEDVYGQDMIVSTTDLTLWTYGADFFEDYADRLGVADRDDDKITVLRSVVMDPWITETAGGGDFMDKLEAALLRAASVALGAVKHTPSRGY
jgi:glutamate/tyrosine decarboxylase-like PLP-dependent enzyme